MIKPTVYKSLSYLDIKARKGTQVSDEVKSKANFTLNKFVEFFKLKHL